MPSQFFGLNIAGSGLRNSNAALNTTANNISNVQTEGYSRQQVDSQAADALRTFTTYGCAGAGVETIAIERIRDSFYDVKYWNNNANYGQYEAKSYYMKTIEDYFDDDGDTGFVTIFNKMSNCLQSITTNASSTSTKAQFVASAEAFTDYFNSLYGNLQELQKDVNLEIKQCVDQINSISEQIATLNKQINVIEISAGTANDLRDQRDLMVDRLSEYIDVTVEETPIYDSNDPTRETGGSRYVVKIAGGQILLDGNDFSTLSCVARTNTEKINQTDIEGLYKIAWADTGNEFNLNNAAMNGKLKGLVQMRDGNNTANFVGTVSATDQANKKVTVKVSEDYLKSLDESTLPEPMAGGEIVINNANYFFTSWSFDEAASEYTFTINDTKGAAAEGKWPATGTQAKTQEAIPYQGIPYYMEQMNAFLRKFTCKINETFQQGTNAYGSAGVNLFSCKLAAGELTEDQLNTFKKTDPGYGYTLPDGDVIYDGYYFMTCGNVCISTAMLEDADLLGSRTDGSFGVEECGQVKEAIDILSDKKKFNFRNASANQMLELVLSDVALNASNANMYINTFEGLKNSIDNQRTAISGVDEDEEAVNLVKYQNSYTLASKMIQTLTEVYDQLILNTGV